MVTLEWGKNLMIMQHDINHVDDVNQYVRQIWKWRKSRTSSTVRDEKLMCIHFSIVYYEFQRLLMWSRWFWRHIFFTLSGFSNAKVVIFGFRKKWSIIPSRFNEMIYYKYAKFQDPILILRSHDRQWNVQKKWVVVKNEGFIISYFYDQIIYSRNHRKFAHVNSSALQVSMKTNWDTLSKFRKVKVRSNFKFRDQQKRGRSENTHWSN